MIKLPKEKIKLEIYEKGITLISLVITIIILLILSTISVGLIFNSDGLFIKANNAANKYNQSKEEELILLQEAKEYLDKYNKIHNIETTGTPTPVLPPKGEKTPEEGWTIEEAKGLIVRDGLQVHLGERVQYNLAKDPTGVYRIFYYDNEVNSEDSSKGYFGDPLGTLYLKREYVSNDTIIKEHIDHIPSDNGEIMKKMNPKWAKESNGNSIDLKNEHCVAWLCDPREWTNYKVEEIANYAIGSPSIEMYMKAYNVYKDNNPNSTTLINRIGNINGYNVGTQGSYNWNGAEEHYTADNSIEVGPNNIFRTSGDCFWWLSSPSSYSISCILNVNGKNAAIHNNSEYRYGVCPIVSIK